LERQGFEVFYPRCQPSGRGKLEPLFRTYVFVRIVDQWLKIESTYGVSGILKTDGVPTRVPPRTVKWLKGMENSDGVVELQTQRALVKGETVQIVKGAFKGHIMLYDGATAEGRVKALYEFLGSRITVEFNRHYVAPAGALPLPAEAETQVSPGAVASQEPVSERMARQRAARLAKAASEAKRSPPTDGPQTKTPKTKSKRNAH
jgi:transcription antitermination factor NusG